MDEHRDQAEGSMVAAGPARAAGAREARTSRDGRQREEQGHGVDMARRSSPTVRPGRRAVATDRSRTAGCRDGGDSIAPDARRAAVTP